MAVFPVCTGLNRIRGLNMLKFTRVPRMHGAKPPATAKLTLDELCSPYARG